MPDLFVVGAVVEQQLLIVAQKRCSVCEALVPEQHQPSPWPENARELASRLRPIKPVRRLRRTHEMHRLVRQRRDLRGSRNTGEPRKIRQQSLPRLSHLRIRLDAEHRVAVLEQHASPDPGSRSNVGNHVLPCQAALFFEHPQHLRRISRTVANVIFDAVGSGWWHLLQA